MKTIVIRYLLALICLSLVFSACKKKDKDEERKFTPSFYFRATIDGVAVAYEVGITGHITAAGGGGQTSTLGWLAEQTGNILFISKNHSAAVVGVLKDFPAMPSPAENEAMLSLGSYPWGNSSSPVDGAFVWWVDDQEVFWSSDGGTGDQTGSNFTITQLNSNGLGDANSTMKITFNCILYDGCGASKTLTNGEISSSCLLY